MRVVKEGRLPETLPIRGTCSHCGAVIEGQRGEGKAHNDQREGSWWTVACLTKGCGREIICYEVTK